MKKELIGIILVVALIFIGAFLLAPNKPQLLPQATPTPTPQPEVSATSKGTPQVKVINPEVLLNVVNEWRVENGYSAYQVDQRLCDMGFERLEQIPSDWSHDQFEPTLNKHFNGYNFFGENLARGYSYEADVLSAWLDSPTHRDNLEARVPLTCIVTDGYFVVHLFAQF